MPRSKSSSSRHHLTTATKTQQQKLQQQPKRKRRSPSSQNGAAKPGPSQKQPQPQQMPKALRHTAQRLRRQLSASRRRFHEMKRMFSDMLAQRELTDIQNEQLLSSQRLLEESRDRYSVLYDLAPVALITLCDNGVIREVNLMAAAMLAQPQQPLINVPLILFVADQDRRELLAHLRRCRDASHGSTKLLVTELALRPQKQPPSPPPQQLLPPRRVVPVQLISSPGVMTHEGWRFRSALMDLTHQRRAQETAQRLIASQQSERLLRNVLATLPIGVRVLDREGNVLVSNDVSRQIWGDTAWPTSLGALSSVYDIVSGQPMDHRRMAASRALAGETVLDQFFRIGSGAKARVIRESAIPLRNSEVDSVRGAVVVTEDVTEQAVADQRLREAKESAEEANRAKDEFLAMVSHELRTPVSAILLWAHLLRQGLLPTDEREQAAELIEQSAKTQSQLIEDLLDVSRLVSGKMQLAPVPEVLQSLALEMVESMRPAAQARGVALEAQLQADQELIAIVDPVRFRQVLANLLSNAIKFTPEGGWVRVRMERVADSLVRTAVSDSGIGIAPQFLPYVFERFRQADSSLTRRQGGLGLGLAIARQIVEMHQGTIRAESPGPDMGATFTFELPLAELGTAAVATVAGGRADSLGPQTEPSSPAPLHGVRILLVDDDPRALLATARVLESAGAIVTTAKSAHEALERFRVTRAPHAADDGPDVIVSDIRMPGEDGYSLMRKLRSIEAANAVPSAAAQPAVPAIALSAHARAQDRVDALRAGFQAHIAKPVEAQKLIDVVSRLTRGTAIPAAAAAPAPPPPRVSALTVPPT
jgi:signal transduction histidine kinase/DNA-binding NarL/FixJ family response regulator